MPRNFTLSAIRTRCKQRADMENSGLISDPEWNGLISTAFAALHGLIALPGMRYYECVDTITGAEFIENTDTNTADHQLPENHLSTIGVDYKRGNRWYPLAESMVQERNLHQGYFGSFGNTYLWSHVGCDLRLQPAPRSTDEFRHVYVPQPVNLENVSDTYLIDVVTPEGEEFLVWHVVVNALSKEESDVRNALGARERMREKVERWVINRSLNQPRRPVTDDDEGHYGQRRWGGEWY